VEVLSVQVTDGRSGDWKIVNVYVPPESRTHVEEADLRAMPGSDEGRWLVGGDFNAHHDDWDERVRCDRRGTMLMSWAEEREMVLLNDGSVTRVERGSGGPPSSPDVSFCSKDMPAKREWRVVRELGSDHFPILICFGDRVKREEVKKVLVWDWKRADWKGYADEVKKRLSKFDWASMKVSDMEATIREVVLRAARTFVGRKRLKHGEESTVGSEVAEAMSKRDALRGDDEVDVEELTRADDEVKRLVREERGRRWRGLLMKGASYDEMWSVVRGTSRCLGAVNSEGEDGVGA
jgi:hypothetical protein